MTMMRPKSNHQLRINFKKEAPERGPNSTRYYINPFRGDNNKKKRNICSKWFRQLCFKCKINLQQPSINIRNLPKLYICLLSIPSILSLLTFIFVIEGWDYDNITIVTKSTERIQPKIFILPNQEPFTRLKNYTNPMDNETLLPFLFDEHHKAKIRDDTDPFEVGDCKAMGSWQLEYHPNCNMIHEISERSNDYRGTYFLSNGSYRDTWLVHWNGMPYAMKSLVSDDKMSARNLERHRRDAVIMSMLGSSVHIPNIFAHCKFINFYRY